MQSLRCRGTQTQRLPASAMSLKLALLQSQSEKAPLPIATICRSVTFVHYMLVQHPVSVLFGIHGCVISPSSYHVATKHTATQALKRSGGSAQTVDATYNCIAFSLLCAPHMLCPVMCIKTERNKFAAGHSWASIQASSQSILQVCCCMAMGSETYETQAREIQGETVSRLIRCTIKLMSA